MLQVILGKDTERYTEKAELIDAILASGGSSHCTCAVCYEDYQDGDDVRVRPLYTEEVLTVDILQMCPAGGGMQMPL
jgi:hypothetical protein